MLAFFSVYGVVHVVMGTSLVIVIVVVNRIMVMGIKVGICSLVRVRKLVVVVDAQEAHKRRVVNGRKAIVLHEGVERRRRRSELWGLLKITDVEPVIAKIALRVDVVDVTLTVPIITIERVKELPSIVGKASGRTFFYWKVEKAFEVVTKGLSLVVRNIILERPSFKSRHFVIREVIVFYAIVTVTIWNVRSGMVVFFFLRKDDFYPINEVDYFRKSSEFYN